jgi:hypothetical protein
VAPNPPAKADATFGDALNSQFAIKVDVDSR